MDILGPQSIVAFCAYSSPSPSITTSMGLIFRYTMLLEKTGSAYSGPSMCSRTTLRMPSAPTTASAMAVVPSLKCSITPPESLSSILTSRLLRWARSLGMLSTSLSRKRARCILCMPVSHFWAHKSLPSCSPTP